MRGDDQLRETAMMEKRLYRWALACPRCAQATETTTDTMKTPRVCCADCLLNDVEVVEMAIVAVTEEIWEEIK
jgi:hypothetical protein